MLSKRHPLLQPMTAVAALLGGAMLAPTAFAASYATVVSSTPVIVQVAQPRQVCSDSQQLVQQRPSGVGAVVGAIAGGVLGNAVGGGFGRAAATGLGVVAGSVVGNNVEANNAGVAAVPVRSCQNVTSYESRTVGYDVVYDYAGQRYSTRMQRDPGHQFAVNVQPADNGGSIAVPVADSRSSGTPVPAPGSTNGQNIIQVPAPAQTYYDPLPVAQPTYVTPAYAPPAYYYDSPGYYYGPSPYVAPLIGLGVGFGLGYYGGYHGGYHGGYRGGYGGGHRWH